MGWKMILIVLFCMCANPICTYAADYSCYDGSISSTYLDMFDNYTLGFDEDYVLFRSEQYVYYLVVGDISCTGTIFTSSEECTVYSISQYVQNNNYQSHYMVDMYTIDCFNLQTDGKLVYSNLDGYPALHDLNVIYNAVEVLILAVFTGCYLISNIFRFVLRNKRGDL